MLPGHIVNIGRMLQGLIINIWSNAPGHSPFQLYDFNSWWMSARELLLFYYCDFDQSPKVALIFLLFFRIPLDFNSCSANARMLPVRLSCDIDQSPKVSRNLVSSFASGYQLAWTLTSWTGESGLGIRQRIGCIGLSWRESMNILPHVEQWLFAFGECEAEELSGSHSSRLPKTPRAVAAVFDLGKVGLFRALPSFHRCQP